MTDGITGRVETFPTPTLTDLEKIDICLAQFIGGPSGVEGICARIKQLNEMRLENLRLMTKSSQEWIEDIEELREENKQLTIQLEQSRVNCDKLQQDWDKYYADHQ